MNITLIFGRCRRSSEYKRYFCKFENFVYGEINERGFDNPNPRTTSPALGQSYVITQYRWSYPGGYGQNRQNIKHKRSTLNVKSLHDSWRALLSEQVPSTRKNTPSAVCHDFMAEEFIKSSRSFSEFLGAISALVSHKHSRTRPLDRSEVVSNIWDPFYKHRSTEIMEWISNHARCFMCDVITDLSEP